MRQALALLVLLSSLHASAQEKQLSPRAVQLTEALTLLQTSPNDPVAQERYLKTFPHDYKEFLNLFDFGSELYDGHDFIDALSLTSKGHGAELGKLLVGLAKDAHHEADAPSALQQVTAVYAGRHAKTFAQLFKELPAQKQMQVLTFLADAENHHSYPEYQAIIDSLKRIGEERLATRFEEARANREKQSDR